MIIIGIVLVLIAFRLYLPTLVKDYLNKMLSEIEGYTGSVEDVDLALYRGAYRISDLSIFSTTQEIGRPFFATDGIDISLSWKDIFKGSIVGDIKLEKPQLNFVTVEGVDSVETGGDVDWTEPIRDLLPISINSFEIAQGKVSYIDDFSDPKVNVYINEIDFRLENLRNTEDKENALPSPYRLSAVSLGNGRLNASGKANLLREIPNFDVDLKFEEADLTAFNNFFEAYVWFDFERGDFNLYTEMALIDSTLNGYVKPILNDVKVLDWKNEEKGFLNKLYQGVVGGGLEALENQGKDQTATEVTISGTINATNVGIVAALIELLKNAFINPLRKELESRIAVKGKQIVSEDDKDGKKKKDK